MNFISCGRRLFCYSFYRPACRQRWQVYCSCVNRVVAICTIVVALIPLWIVSGVIQGKYGWISVAGLDSHSDTRQYCWLDFQYEAPRTRFVVLLLVRIGKHPHAYSHLIDSRWPSGQRTWLQRYRGHGFARRLRAPASATFLRFICSNRYSLRHIEGLKMLVVILREFTVTCTVSGENWSTLPCYQDGPL